jgi:Cu2+-exporting ATPase
MPCCSDTRASARRSEDRPASCGAAPLTEADAGPAAGTELVLSVPAVRCGQCIATVERARAACGGVASARVNLTLRRVRLTLAPGADPELPLGRLAAIGYPATPIEPAAPEGQGSTEAASTLLRALAVAGFGSMNVMLLSVAVWSGADGATRQTFHLISALIALPVVAYAGRPFFASALTALRARRLNMDVPISLGVLLTLGLSLFETVRGGPQAFFDAAVTLLFFLLAGRYLDAIVRDRARSAVDGLARLAPKAATRLRDDGTTEPVPLRAVSPGTMLRIAPGERVPVDVRVVRGETDLDRSLVTGESEPAPARPGDELEAGTLNLTGCVDAVALRPAETSFLAEVQQMLAAAERGRGRYVRIADRAAQLYAPVVHLLAAAIFAGWLVATGGDWRAALFVAISVLIITCPCALGLAVPVVHVVGAGRLFREGIMMKDGSALERLAGIDRVVFDKTGTLTTGTPQVTGGGPSRAEDRAAARALALHSAHPAAKAIARSLPDAPVAVEGLREVPGHGVEATIGGQRARLGRADWVAAIAGGPAGPDAATAFAFEGGPAAAFAFSEALRPGAREAVAGLRAAGLEVELVSGDGPAPVARVARELGIAEARHGCTPSDKIAHLEALRAAGHRVLMVGDGLNDTAALAAAHVSIAPASAVDAGRQAADFVFTRDRLDAVATAHRIARAAARLVAQNFGFAAAYNCVAIPFAVAGLVTPLIAALAMSASSILVVLNALRLNAGPPPESRRSAPGLHKVPA